MDWRKGRDGPCKPPAARLFLVPLLPARPGRVPQHLLARRQGDLAGPSSVSGRDCLLSCQARPEALKHPRLGPVRSMAPCVPVPAPRWERATEPVCSLSKFLVLSTASLLAITTMLYTGALDAVILHNGNCVPSGQYLKKNVTYTRQLEKEMAIHSSILAGRIPRTEEPGRLQSLGSQELDMTWRLKRARD